MQIRTLTGDDEINLYLMAAMGATVERMYQEGILNKEQAEDFIDKHLCLMIDSRSGFTGWFKRMFLNRTNPVIKVVQVNAEKETKKTESANPDSDVETLPICGPICPICKKEMSVDTSGLWLCKICQSKNDRCTWSIQELNEEYRKRKKT